MSFSVLLTDDAAHDLEDLCDYIDLHDVPHKADYVLKQLEKAFNSLSEKPHRGAYPKELLSIGVRTKYKPVAHLWAAWHEFTGDSKADLQADLSGFSHNPLFDDFPRFLTVAEYFRKFGEGTKTSRPHKGRNEFFLDANETWKVPDNYPLPAISPPHYSGPFS